MTIPRVSCRLLLSLALAATPACGGGADGGLPAGPTAPVATAILDGQVLEVDGQTTALAGIAVVLAETATTAVTGADGAFSLGAVPTGSLTLDVSMPTAGAPSVVASGSAEGDGGRGAAGNPDPGGGPSGAGPDEIEDGEDLNGNGTLEIHRARDRERIRVQLRIQDGAVLSMTCSRDGDRDGDGECDGERDVEVRMTLAESSDDDDIAGELDLDARAGRECFRVQVEGATPDRLLAVVAIDPAGLEDPQGTATVGADGAASWEFDAFQGDRLPFGATTVAELEGYRAEVRDASTALLLLFAEVPELPPLLLCDPDRSGDPSPDAERLRARVRLQAEKAGLEGSVELRSRAEDGTERFEMRAEHLAAGRTAVFEIETARQSERFSRIGAEAANASGEARLTIDTRNGDTLPNGALGVRQLQRLRVRVRDADTDALLLTGTVPDLVIER